MASEYSTPLFYSQIQDSWWWFLCQHFLQTLRNLGLISVVLLPYLLVSVWKLEFPGFRVILVGVGRGGETRKRGGNYFHCGVGTLNNALCWSWDQESCRGDRRALCNWPCLLPSLLAWEFRLNEENTQRSWNWSPEDEPLGWGELCLLGMLWQEYFCCCKKLVCRE